MKMNHHGGTIMHRASRPLHLSAFRWLLTCLLAWALGSPLAAQDRVLEWKFKLGDKFQLVTTSELKQIIRATRQEEQKLDTIYVITSTFQVTKASEEVYELKQTIDSIQIQAPSGLAPSKLYQQLQGVSFTLTLNKDKQLTKLDGYEEMMKKITGDDPNLRRVVQSILPEETLRTSVQESIGFLPSKSVNLGHQWERSFSMALGSLGTMQVTNQYTYEKDENVQNDLLAVIKVQPRFQYQAPKADPVGMPMQVLRGSVQVEPASGLIWFDRINGRLVKSEMKLTLKGKFDVRTSGQEATIEIEQDQKVEIRRVETAK